MPLRRHHAPPAASPEGETAFRRIDPATVPCPLDTVPTLAAEQWCTTQGWSFVAGLDEVGRGCLAGPVVAAAVVLSPDDTMLTLLQGVRDSKQLSAARRTTLAQTIRTYARTWGLGIIDVATIDRHNILAATKLAMQAAIAMCQPAPEVLLLDALTLPAVPLPQIPFIKGDQRSLSIAAASILAKVARDELMTQLDRIYPGYGFAQHKGYGTATHLAALQRMGPCPEHRRTFAPVRALLEPPPAQGTLLTDETL